MSLRKKIEPSSRFVEVAEKWLSLQSVERLGIHTPSIMVYGSHTVIMDALEFNRDKPAAALMTHLGQLADILKIAIRIEHANNPYFYRRLGFRPVDGALTRSPGLHEDLEPYAPLRRWWINTVSGDTIAVPEDTDHPNYLRDHQTQFGIDRHHKWSESDKLGEAAAQHGWQPAAYDSVRHWLTISVGNGTQKVLRRIVQGFKDQLPLAAVTVKVGTKSRELIGSMLDRFLRNGRLPSR